MATNAQFPPYEMVADGEGAYQGYEGIDIELAVAIADKLGLKLEVTDIAFDSIIPGVQTGKYDIGLAGMTVTDEPGIYETDKIGIRIENELLCKEAMESEYGKFYCFEPITYCPIDRKAIDPKKLSPAELSWLNQYHATVYETLSPYLTDSENEWLKKACAPIA